MAGTLPSLLSPGGESSPAIPERKDESEGDKVEFSPPFLEMRGESEGDQGERVVRVLTAILKRKGESGGDEGERVVRVLTTILERAGDEVELPPRHSLLPVR